MLKRYLLHKTIHYPLVALKPTGQQPLFALLHHTQSHHHLQDVYYPWRPFLRDPDDDMVLECAVASNSQYLVTHNIQHFQRIVEVGVMPITPASFLAFLRSSP